MVIPIINNWQFRRAGDKEWLPANVPGTVHDDLISNNAIENPHYRFNEDDVQWIENEDWEYRTSFLIDQKVLKQDVAELLFEGLDTYADVFLNGQLLVEASNMFVEYKIACKSQLMEGENELRIHFHSPVKRGMEKLKRFGHSLPADNELAPEGKRTNVFTRKAPFHYGWDWGPRLVTSGIWRPVKLIAWKVARIEDVCIYTKSANKKIAHLAAKLDIESLEHSTVNLSIIINGKSAAQNLFYNLKPGSNRIRFSFCINRPKLWWPNGLGDPYMYNIAFTLENKNVLLHTYQLKYGVRMLKLIQTPDNRGRSFYFEVNGQPVFMKGANVIPPETITSSNKPTLYESLIEHAVDANMNMLRVWGGGVYKDDHFYRLCDENGLLVWQDFMFACSLQPGNDEHLENIRKEAEYNVKRLRNHACLALWCGNNEILKGWHEWGWEKRFDKELREYLWETYQKIFHDILPATIREHDPGRSYHASSPSTYDNMPSDSDSGDEHDWRVWFGQKAFTAYVENVARFVSEYGFQAFPTLATIKSYAAAEDMDWNSRLMRYRQRCKMSWLEQGFDGNDNIRRYMELYFEVPDDFERFVYVSQLLQAMALKSAIEAHRAAMPHCMGSLYWQLNDCWPTISWATIDHFSRWKAAHYAVKNAFRPVIITATNHNGIITINAISDKMHDIDAVLTSEWMDFSGNIIERKEIKARIPANASSLITKIQHLVEKHDCNQLLLYLELRADDSVIADNILYFTHPKDLKLSPPKISYRLSKLAKAYKLTLKANTLVKGLCVEACDPDFHFSDNFFDLIPGKPRTLQIQTWQDHLDQQDIRFTYLNPDNNRK